MTWLIVLMPIVFLNAWAYTEAWEAWGLIPCVFASFVLGMMAGKADSA